MLNLKVPSSHIPDRFRYDTMVSRKSSKDAKKESEKVKGSYPVSKTDQFIFEFLSIKALDSELLLNNIIITKLKKKMEARYFET